MGIRKLAEPKGTPVERVLLHERVGLGAASRRQHPLYGRGADVVVTDDALVPIAGIERKTLDDLARSLMIGAEGDAPRMFRQLSDLASHPVPVLLLEGNASMLYRRAEPAALGLQFWAARQGITILYSTSLASSARAVHQIVRKLDDTYALPGARIEIIVPEDRPEPAGQASSDGPPGPWDPPT